MHKLTEIRNKMNLTPKEMANLLGVSLSYYYKIEESSRNPSYNFLMRCKSKLSINVDEIFFSLWLYVLSILYLMYI